MRVGGCGQHLNAPLARPSAAQLNTIEPALVRLVCGVQWSRRPSVDVVSNIVWRALGQHSAMVMEVKMCRACLVLLPRDDEVCCHNLILERELAVRFVECTLQTLDMHDEFPKCICHSCYEMLHKFNDFQKMCVESMLNFKNFLNEQMDSLEGELLDGESDVAVIGVKEQTMSIGNTRATDNGVGANTVELEEVFIVSSTTDENDFAENKVEEISMPVCDAVASQNSTKPNATLNRPNHNQPHLLDRSVSAHQNDGVALYHCERCPTRWFYKKERLQAHQRTHLGLKPYVCQVCCKGFGRAATLQTHMADMHDTSKAHHSCTYAGCSKVYMAARTLRHHINTAHLDHSRGKEYVCEECGKRFNRKLLLQRHRYVHMDHSLYPYACEHCDKRFWSKQFLRVHINRHAGNRRFVCLVCEAQKYTKGELKRHMQLHTGARPFKCDLCNCSFLQKTHLVTHLRRKHERA